MNETLAKFWPFKNDKQESNGTNGKYDVESEVDFELQELKVVNKANHLFVKLEYDFSQQVKLNSNKILLQEVIQDYSQLMQAYFQEDQNKFIEILSKRMRISLSAMREDKQELQLDKLITGFSQGLQRLEKPIPLLESLESRLLPASSSESQQVEESKKPTPSDLESDSQSLEESSNEEPAPKPKPVEPKKGKRSRKQPNKTNV